MDPTARSSTSSSEAGSRRGAAVRAAGIFALAVLLGGAALGGYWSTLSRNARMALSPEPYLTLPPLREAYLAYVYNVELDQAIHYWGTHPEIEASIRQADVLFVGNSRMMFGISDELLGRYFDWRGWRYYKLGFGWNESSAFPLDILRRLHPHPKFVVADPNDFFGLDYSNPTREAIALGRRNARVEEFEIGTTFRYRRIAHRLLPRLNFVPTFPLIFFRSVKTGAWLPTGMPDQVFPFDTLPRWRPPSPREIAAARALKAECDELGARLVLAYVPTPAGIPSEAEALARLLGVPLIMNIGPRLATFDWSHLTPDSAAVVTRAFLNQAAPLLEGQ